MDILDHALSQDMKGELMINHGGHSENHEKDFCFTMKIRS